MEPKRFLKMIRLFFTKNLDSMKYAVRDILEYIIALVNEFADRYGLSEKQAYLYIRKYNGISFIETNYGIIHTLDFNEAVESVALFCKRHGGKL